MEIAHNGIKSKELAQQIQSWYQTGGGLACVDLFALLVALKQEEHQCGEGVTLKTICATRSHYEDLDKYQRIQVRKQIHNLMDKAKRRNYVERLSCDEPIFKLTQRGLAFIATALARVQRCVSSCWTPWMRLQPCNCAPRPWRKKSVGWMTPWMTNAR